MAKLGEIATYINGYPFKPEDWSDEGVPIIRIQDLSGNSYQTNRYNGKYASKYEVNDGDVLISWSASLGVYIWHGEKAVLNQHIFKVVFDKAEVDKSFFVHQVGEILEKAATSAHGATMKHLTKPVFDALPFYLPPIEEQRHIAAVLDKVTDLIAQRRAQLDKLDLLVKARFVEMFGDIATNSKYWKKDKLQNHIDMITGFPFNSAGYSQNGIKICGGLIIMPNQIKWDDCKFWPTSQGYEQFLLQKNDIVVALDRPWISEGFKIGQIHEGDLPALLIQRTARIRSKDLDQTFLLYLLKDKAFEIHCTVTGSLVPHISNKDINSYNVIIPPLELQKQFSDFETKNVQLSRKIKHSLKQLETLKKAFMQQYFE